MRTYLTLLFVLLATNSLVAAPKPHLISFGKVMVVKWYVGAGEKQSADLKVRALYVDTRMKEFTVGSPHEVTDRLFVIRRAFRLNDTLPEESTGAPRWRWQRGGWLLVDRVTGRVSQLVLPDFDPYYSLASWYRDYVAYCGVSDDGTKLYAIVAQLGMRKPVLRKSLGETARDDSPDSECPAPAWQRQPPRVTFEPDDEQKLTYSVRGHVVDVVSDAEDDEDTASK